jgi:hypothetical protein
MEPSLDLEPQENEVDLPRPMSNLLIPPGLVKPYHYVEDRRGDPHALTDPMHGSVGAYIKTERGVRRVLPEETGRGLGIPKELRVSSIGSIWLLLYQDPPSHHRIQSQNQ